MHTFITRDEAGGVSLSLRHARSLPAPSRGVPASPSREVATKENEINKWVVTDRTDAALRHGR